MHGFDTNHGPLFLENSVNLLGSHRLELGKYTAFKEVILSKTNFSSSLTCLYALLAKKEAKYFKKNHNLRMSMWASILRVMAMKPALGLWEVFYVRRRDDYHCNASAEFFFYCMRASSHIPR